MDLGDNLLTFKIYCKWHTITIGDYQHNNLFFNETVFISFLSIPLSQLQTKIMLSCRYGDFLLPLWNIFKDSYSCQKQTHLYVKAYLPFFSFLYSLLPLRLLAICSYPKMLLQTNCICVQCRKLIVFFSHDNCSG